MEANKYRKFALAAAAGGATEAMALLALCDGFGTLSLEFENFSDLVSRLAAAKFHQAVPWSTSTAHFEADDALVSFVSCAGTRVTLYESDDEPHVWLINGEEADADHYRVRAMAA